MNVYFTDKSTLGLDSRLPKLCMYILMIKYFWTQIQDSQKYSQMLPMAVLMEQGEETQVPNKGTHSTKHK